jgi:hypothetical protein
VVQFSAGVTNFSIVPKVSKLALGPTQSPTKWVPDIKHLECTADYSPPSDAEVKIEWSYTSIPPKPS